MYALVAWAVRRRHNRPVSYGPRPYSSPMDSPQDKSTSSPVAWSVRELIYDLLFVALGAILVFGSIVCIGSTLAAPGIIFAALLIGFSLWHLKEMLGQRYSS